jgi:hypothetical protein
MKTSAGSPRGWRRLTPDHGIVGLFAVQILLWLSQRQGWFGLGDRKGWALLIAAAVLSAF